MATKPRLVVFQFHVSSKAFGEFEDIVDERDPGERRGPSVKVAGVRLVDTIAKVSLVSLPVELQQAGYRLADAFSQWKFNPQGGGHWLVRFVFAQESCELISEPTDR